MQGQQTTDTKMCKLRTRARHFKSPLPKKKMEIEKNAKTVPASQGTTQKQDRMKPAHTTG